MIPIRPHLHHRSGVFPLQFPPKTPSPLAPQPRRLTHKIAAAKDQNRLLQQLKDAALGGKGLSAEDLKNLVEEEEAAAAAAAATEKSEEKEGQDVKDVEIPTRMKNLLKGIGLWDAIPPEGLRFGSKKPEESDKDKGIWTDAEYNAMVDHDFEGTDEEELEHELTRLRAVRKLEAELNKKETDPQKLFNRGLRFKRFENDEPVDEIEDLIDDMNPETVEPDPDIDKFLRMQAKGERLPHVSTWDDTVLPPEDPATYLERFNLAKKFILDTKKKSKYRSLPPEKFNEIMEKWKAYSKEYDAKMDDAFQEEMSVPQEAPDWPDWQDAYNNTAQHIYNLLRCAYIDGTTTEIPRRLKKYDFAGDDLEFIVNTSVVETTGFDAYFDHMFKLRSSGVTTQPANLFMVMDPPKGQVSEDNPFQYMVVCDYYCNVPIPQWYRDIIAEIEREREEKRNAKAKEGGWRSPIDFSEYTELWSNKANLKIMQSMDNVMKSIPKDQAMKREETPQTPASTWEIGDDDPYPDEGPVWLEEQAKGDEWKHGKVFTINSTARYTIDVKNAKVSKIEITWGAMIGDINTMEDGEKLFRIAAGLDSSITTGDYRSFEVLVYDKLFKNPVEWLKEAVLKPIAKKNAEK